MAGAAVREGRVKLTVEWGSERYGYTSILKAPADAGDDWLYKALGPWLSSFARTVAESGDLVSGEFRVFVENSE